MKDVAILEPRPPFIGKKRNLKIPHNIINSFGRVLRLYLPYIEP